MKTALEEFFTNNNDEETLMEMKGYTVDAWSEIIKVSRCSFGAIYAVYYH